MKSFKTQIEFFSFVFEAIFDYHTNPFYDVCFASVFIAKGFVNFSTQSVIYGICSLSCGWSRKIKAFHLPRTLLKKDKIFFALSVKRKLSKKTSRPHMLSLIACKKNVRKFERKIALVDRNFFRTL